MDSILSHGRDTLRYVVDTCTKLKIIRKRVFNPKILRRIWEKKRQIMVKVSIYYKGKIITLPSLDAGNPNGQLTDYKKPGKEIIVFMLNEEREEVVVFYSEAGFHIDLPGSKALLSPKVVRGEKIIKKGEQHEIPFRMSTLDKAVLILNYDKN